MDKTRVVEELLYEIFVYCFVIVLLSAFAILENETCEKKRGGLQTSEQKLSPNRLPHPLYNWVSKRDKEIRGSCDFSFLSRLRIYRMYINIR